MAQPGQVSNQPDEWQDVSCPLCPAGTAANHFQSCGDRFTNPSLRNFNLLSCKGCGLIFLSPHPPLDLTSTHHKQEGYDPFVSFSKQLSFTEKLYIKARIWSSRWKRRLVIRLIPNGSKVLDIGCGTGEFLLAIKDVMQTTGVEPEQEAAQWGRKNSGLDIRTGFLEDVELPAGSFQLITMWHALEHIPEPLKALDRVRELLAPDGKILIALPNINSYDASFYGPDWVAIDAPRHRWHFTPDTLKQIAQRAGLTVKKSKILPLDHFYNILMSEEIHRKAAMGHPVFSPLRMAVALTGSMLKALFEREGSGMYYILTK